jgi:DNA-directed RNA polymerase subunit RPC12/RpoP
MARTADMFAEPKPQRAKPRVMMHGDDYGYDGDITLGHMVCDKCGHVEGWLMFDNDTEAKRGVPCPQCNKRPNTEAKPTREAGSA